MWYDYYSNLTYYLLQIDLDRDLNEWKKEKKVNYYYCCWYYYYDYNKNPCVAIP